MRKVICVLMCAIFLTTPVIASDIDLSGYSADELIELQHRISDTLAANGGLTLISGGNYVVGRDIAAGSYIIKTYGDEGFVEYYVYKSEEALAKYENAKKKYRKAHSDARTRKDAGEEPDWPREVNEKKFINDSGTILSGNESGIQLNLSDGQLLVLDVDIFDVPMSIEKVNGLFME